MVLKNDKGTQLLANNLDLPAKLDFTAPSDGDFTLEVKHWHKWGGPDEVYRLTVTPYEPGFSLSLNLDRWNAAPGGTTSIPIFVTRSGYNGPIEVSVIGAKGLSGTLTIPAGAKPPTAPSGLLTLKAADDLPPGPLEFHIQGKALMGKPVVRLAMRPQRPVAEHGRPGGPAADNVLLAGPGHHGEAALCGGRKVRCTLRDSGQADHGDGHGRRQAGFTAEVAVSVVGLPVGVTAKPVKIPAGKTEGKVTVNLRANIKVGQILLTFQGAAKHAGRDFVAMSPPAPLAVKKK